MNQAESAISETLLRKFLLGQVDERQRNEVEKAFLTNPAERERILVVEQDLIEDYLEDGLTVAEIERFAARYLQTSKQRRLLRIMRSIKEYALLRTEQ